MIQRLQMFATDYINDITANVGRISCSIQCCPSNTIITLLLKYARFRFQIVFKWFINGIYVDHRKSKIGFLAEIHKIIWDHNEVYDDPLPSCPLLMHVELVTFVLAWNRTEDREEGGGLTSWDVVRLEPD